MKEDDCFVYPPCSLLSPPRLHVAGLFLILLFRQKEAAPVPGLGATEAGAAILLGRVWGPSEREKNIAPSDLHLTLIKRSEIFVPR
jgi:hypothetical protein